MLLGCALLCVAVAITKPQPLPALSVASNSTSISGLSSGAYMAVQMHVAFSKEFIGVGAVAGGPFYCAKANIVTAQNACMKNPSLINVQTLVQITRNTAVTGTIDPVSNLRNSRVWIFGGKADSVVIQDVGKALEKYYGNFVTGLGDVKTVGSFYNYRKVP